MIGGSSKRVELRIEGCRPVASYRGSSKAIYRCLNFIHKSRATGTLNLSCTLTIVAGNGRHIACDSRLILTGQGDFESFLEQLQAG